MLLQRASTFRIEPTDAQAEAFAQWVGACRFVYNLALEQRRDWHRPGRTFSYYQQQRELTALRNAAKNILQARTLAVEPPKRTLRRVGKRKHPRSSTAYA